MVCARVEVPDVTPRFEFIIWKNRHFAWRQAEERYVETTVFLARGEVVTEQDGELPRTDGLPEEFQI